MAGVFNILGLILGHLPQLIRIGKAVKSNFDESPRENLREELDELEYAIREKDEKAIRNILNTQYTGRMRNPKRNKPKSKDT